MRVQFEPGYVLARRPYRETSLLLEAFTRRHGRVGLVARGARAGRKGAAALQTFAPFLLSWSEHGELGTLTAAEPEAMAPPLPGECVIAGWYVNELVLRLLQRHDPHADVFDAYRETIANLTTAEPEPWLRRFEKRLLAGIGYGLLLPPDLQAGAWYRYDWERGPQPAEPSDGAYPGAALIALRDERFDDPTQLALLKKLLRAALARQLGAKPLQSARLARGLRRSLAMESVDGD